MSQFDLPRINFFGEALINPPTANNNSFFPLVLFDPIQVKAVMPPRIYVSENIKSFHKLGLLQLPQETQILQDEHNVSYIEISAINTQKVYKEWVITPLGQSLLDKDFHLLYNFIRIRRNNQPLIGIIPGHWNYFGGMEFKFKNVKVNSVELPEKNFGSKLYTNTCTICPPDVEELIGASVDISNEDGKTSAVMVNVNTTLPYYAQVFYEEFKVTKSGNELLKGKPSKASSRFLNLKKIVNLDGALAGAGTFFCTIAISDLKDSEYVPIMRFLMKYENKGRKVAGISIRYTLLEVNEETQPDYTKILSYSNPASCSVLGCITLWYQGDLQSITMGRQFIPDQPYLEGITLPPFIFKVDPARKVINLDMVAAIPEVYTDGLYETYDLGEITLRYRLIDNSEVIIGRINIDPIYLSRSKVIDTGGIVNITYSHNLLQDDESFLNGTFLLYGRSIQSFGKAEAEVVLMRETAYMVASDQAGLYINQHEDPRNGYTSYSNIREPCRLTIFQKGIPFNGDVLISVKELKFNSVSSRPTLTTIIEDIVFRNNDELLFPTKEAANVLYMIYLENRDDLNFHKYILDTGFFISMRVLPVHDYSKYLDPKHPKYSSSIDFETIYNEVLKVYDLIYPLSSIITPFQENYFRMGWHFVKHRLSPENWCSATYMPSSRDMSEDQWQLLCKWAEQL